jgi:DNA-binding LacI/PurR family transcriptional regulator
VKHNKPLYTQIYEILRDQILSGKLRPGDRLPSESELAEKFSVSLITSKRALNDLSDESLVIRVKGKGSFVAGKNGTDIIRTDLSIFRGVVGMIVPSICMPIESELFYYTQSFMHQSQYQTLIRVTDDRLDLEEEAIRMFSIFGVRGFIIFPAVNEKYNEEILRLSLNHFPHILVDRYLPNITSSFVVSDNLNAMDELMRYLFALGHRRISFLTQCDTNTNTHERLAGFEAAYQKAGLLLDKSHLSFERQPNTSHKAYKVQLAKYLRARTDITAIVAMDVVLASLCYAVLHEIGRNAGKDVTLVSFDDPKLPFIPFAKQDIKLIAKRSTEILISQIEDSYQIICEKIPMTFVKDVSYPLPFGVV